MTHAARNRGKADYFPRSRPDKNPDSRDRVAPRVGIGAPPEAGGAHDRGRHELDLAHCLTTLIEHLEPTREPAVDPDHPAHAGPLPSARLARQPPPVVGDRPRRARRSSIITVFISFASWLASPAWGRSRQ